MSKYSPAAILFDVLGNALRVVQDGSDYVLGALAKIAQREDDSSYQYLKANADGSLKATLYDVAGNAIAMPAGTNNPALYVNPKLKLNGTGAESMLVNGSVTPQNFQLLADPAKDYSINTITFVIVSNSLTFGGGNFGAISALANGCRIALTSNGVESVIYTLTCNEGFLHMATPGGFDLVIANKDMIYSIVSLGGAVILKAGTSDKIEVRVQDNLTSAGNYFVASVKGVREE